MGRHYAVAGYQLRINHRDSQCAISNIEQILAIDFHIFRSRPPLGDNVR